MGLNEGTNPNVSQPTTNNNQYINNPVVIANSGFIIFFDNIRVDQFVTDYSTTLGVNSTIGTATINMIYVPDLDEVTHTKDGSIIGDFGLSFGGGTEYTKTEDGVENMTNVRIFVKNVFNDKYVQIFGGNIVGKSTTITGGQRRLTFQAHDFMNWFTRTVCPIAVPYDQTLALGDRLKWQAQGIDISKVKAVNSMADINFKGKTLSQVWQTISEQTMKANSLYSNEDTVSHWDDAINRVAVMGDVKEDLRNAEVVDFMITSSVTQVNSIYVMMNDILNTLMFEFFQDRDEVIRIKPPFWNEHVLKNHVIDPSLIISITESSDFSRMYTRSIATGGLDEWHKDITSGSSESAASLSLITPVVAVTSGGLESTTGCIAVTSETSASNGGVAGSNIATKAVNIALAQIGTPYVWGGASPGGFDCSGLIDYAYKKAGYTGFGERETTYTLVNRGRNVSSLNDIMPGDLILPHSGHVYMAINKTEIVEAQQTGTNVMRRAMPSGFWRIIRLVEWDGASNTSSTDYVQPESVGDKTLLLPTALEKRYGPLIYECTQPLIKFSNAGAVNSSLDNYWNATNHGSAYWALTKYARYMLSYLNSNVKVASMQLISMPWLRPGFNVWVDPLNLNKVYYINTINHYGNESGNYTTISVSMGRKLEDFIGNTQSIGGLKPGQSDDIFVNQLLISPENFGAICNYDEIKKLVKAFYETDKGTIKEFFSNNPYFKYFYNNENQGSKFETEFAPQTVTTASSATVDVAPSLDRLLKVTSPMLNGDDVRNAQTYLSNAGYNPGKADGWYGYNTQSAVRAFQSDNGLSADGQIGPLTWAKLTANISATGNSNSSASGGYGSGTVHVSSSGLRIRSGPSTSFAQIGSLWNGDSVQIICEQDGWYNIVFNGADGWSSANYITKTAEPSSAVESANNAEYSSKYASHSLTSDMGEEMTIAQIQEKLNNKYAGAAAPVIKRRVSRLQKIITSANLYLTKLSESNYTEKPFSTATGSSITQQVNK